MWLNQILRRNAVRRPDAIALADVRREVTWRDFEREVSALAASLKTKAAPGDRVAMVSDNRLEMIEAYFACAAAGVVAVPVNPALADPEIEYILGSVDPAAAVGDETGRRRLAAVRPGLPVIALDEPFGEAAPVAANADTSVPVAILHTSATTGKPKGVVVDERSFQANALSWLADVGVPDGTVFLNACPLFHGSMVIALDYLAAGTTVYVLDKFTPQGCLRALEARRVTHAFLVPSMVRLLLDCRGLADTDLGTLRLLLHGAAPMPDALAAEATARLGVALQTIYGITEGGGPVVTLRPDDKPGQPPSPGAVCAGTPMLGTAVRIEGAAGPGEIGEIQLAGDGLMHGYWGNEAATAEVLDGGWLNTRDLGCFDEEGHLWIVDRRNDLILRGGQNVYPAEIEHVLRQADWVADVAVVPAASETWGQTPVAFVAPLPGREFDEAGLIGLCVRGLAGYKRPSRFIPITEIPRSAAGKILRPRLRAAAEGDLK
ncbi:Acyl-CoA synthetase (AMP-forming)/AMP-acid ligase II [Amycolatopsis xylanica]|uniref:Acyl-CoA synthetase (AMP-forming)/AMP-acid ligase II n=1 Tax=Amycolatopsis xylanica TaxID=589385 RepID=A0A1H2WB73_9PSEU|nr:AMP-binding protein [Amycolatopsis xylanica]SDW77850.1 Acyl-CoA synthetase (AMP-forming)/AMP-acid ligase II [Amycolatopsis xylanica]